MYNMAGFHMNVSDTLNISHLALILFLTIPIHDICHLNLSLRHSQLSLPITCTQPSPLPRVFLLWSQQMVYVKSSGFHMCYKSNQQSKDLMVRSMYKWEHTTLIFQGICTSFNIEFQNLYIYSQISCLLLNKIPPCIDIIFSLFIH